MISEPMVCLAQTMHLSCADTNTVSKWKEVRFHMPKSPRSSIGCVQNDFRAYGTFDANRATILRQDHTISVRTETSFHLSLITQWYHQVYPK
jgi:hypothetical protein